MLVEIATSSRLRRQREQPAHGDRRAERGQERAAADEPASAPLTTPTGAPAARLTPSTAGTGRSEDVEAVERDERRHREIGADREVDAAGRDNDEQRQNDEAAVGRVLREIAADWSALK